MQLEWGWGLLQAVRQVQKERERGVTICWLSAPERGPLGNEEEEEKAAMGGQKEEEEEEGARFSGP